MGIRAERRKRRLEEQEKKQQKIDDNKTVPFPSLFVYNTGCKDCEHHELFLVAEGVSKNVYDSICKNKSRKKFHLTKDIFNKELEVSRKCFGVDIKATCPYATLFILEGHSKYIV